MFSRRRFWISLAVLAASAAWAAAPSPVETLRASREAVRRFVLDNGMTCLVKEDRSAPVVAIQIWVGSGSIHEGRHLGAGLSHAIEHMVFKGTPTRPLGAITRAIHDVGGEINAYTSLDRTVFHAALPAARWRIGLDVLADAAFHASFPEDEWAKEKEVILREMAMDRDDPDSVLRKLMWSTAYTTHPYRHPVIGHEDIFRGITRDDLVSFFREHYVPENMITVVVGDVAAGEAESALRETFGPLPRRSRPAVALPAEPEQIAPRFARTTGAYEISRLAWCYPATDLSHPDTPALDVLAAIVGGGRSGRLVQALRERQKLVLDIEAWSFTPRYPGLFGVSASFEPEKEAAVLEALQREIDRWAREPFREEEVAKARRVALVEALSGLQTMEGQAAGLASDEFHAHDPAFLVRYLERIEKVTPKTVADVARRYLRPEKRTLVILSPERAAEAGAKPSARPAPPEVRRLELSNGMPLIVREDHRLPLVHVCVAFRGGLLSENESNNGITRLMAELLTRGTAERSAEDIARAVESLGASLAPFSGANSFGLEGSCLAQDAATLIGLIAECLLKPAFPQAELEKEREAQLAAIRQQRERPFDLAHETLRQQIFAGHPYRWDPLGTEASVARLDREAVAAHFRALAGPGQAAMAIFGDITPEHARRLCDPYFGPWASAPGALPEHGAAAPTLPARSLRREPRAQAVLLIGYPGVDVKDPRVDALNLLQNAFSGMSSGLFMELREKRGLVYYAGAFQHLGLEPGAFVLYAGTRASAVAELETLIEQEIERICSAGLQEEEFARSREEMIGRHQRHLQNNADLAQECALNELYGLGCDYAFGLEGRLRALSAGAVREAARSLFRKDHRAVSIVLPVEEEQTP